MNRQPVLESELLFLRPLNPEDFASLFTVASDPLLWEQHPAKDRYQKEVFEKFFADALKSLGALAVIDKKTGAIIGTSRIYDHKTDVREVTIGYTFLARSHWGGKFNGELKRLMLEHVFKYVDTVIFFVGEHNFRSQKAVEKLGAKLRRKLEAISGEKIIVTFEYALTKPV